MLISLVVLASVSVSQDSIRTAEPTAPNLDDVGVLPETGGLGHRATATPGLEKDPGRCSSSGPATDVDDMRKQISDDRWVLQKRMRLPSE